ncbi:MAG: hypothetical protein JWL71_3686 [Acidobacteria bacterium]|nr:hypothetical protein [Acidobacteriota bacterium]
MMKVFFLEPAPNAELLLRCFEAGTCPGPYTSYHNADVVLGIVDEPLRPPEDRYERLDPDRAAFSADPRWPAQCACGYAFTEAVERQVNRDRLYRGAPDGQLYSLSNAPVGAMWDAWWMTGRSNGADGICLVVKTPGGDWMVDERASNCTLPNDDVHKCWVRHGDPRTGNVHVDKNGVTCAAGAGSIQQGAYHGFLHNGELTAC